MLSHLAPSEDRSPRGPLRRRIFHCRTTIVRPYLRVCAPTLRRCPGTRVLRRCERSGPDQERRESRCTTVGRWHSNAAACCQRRLASKPSRCVCTRMLCRCPALVTVGSACPDAARSGGCCDLLPNHSWPQRPKLAFDLWMKGSHRSRRRKESTRSALFRSLIFARSLLSSLASLSLYLRTSATNFRADS